ncbi:unnamed protein product [Choristocarpus tenellus]
MAAPLVDAAAILLPRTIVRVTGDSDMLDGLSPGVIVSNKLGGPKTTGLDWWAVLMVTRLVGAHGYTKVMVSERLIQTPILGWLLKLLEFPGIGPCYQGGRDLLKQRLSSFAQDAASARPSVAPYLFLHFPEGETLSQDSLSNSLHFAQREGRPELMRLLLPHTTALSACLDGLLPAKPIVYDMTLAAAGYTGEILCVKPPSNWDVLWGLVTGNRRDVNRVEGGLGVLGKRGGDAGLDEMCAGEAASPTGDSRDVFGWGWLGSAGNGEQLESWRGKGGEETKWGQGCQVIHARMKRYSLEEVLGNPNWLDDRWAEKECLLAHFAKKQSFPSDGRGFPAWRTLDTRGTTLEGTAVALLQLLMVPLAIPVIFLTSLPVVVAMAIAAVFYRLCLAVLGRSMRFLLPNAWVQRWLWRGRGWGCGQLIETKLRSKSGDNVEEDEQGQAYLASKATTPWWGGPNTPLNTPAPGTGVVPYVGSGTNRVHGVNRSRELAAASSSVGFS